MEKFANGARRQSNHVLTENNSVALRTTNSAVLDLFASVGAMRGGNYVSVAEAFSKALDENKLLALKTMFYARNIRGGLGERETFRKMLENLAWRSKDLVEKNIELIPHFGRWDDLYALVNTPAEGSMWHLIRTQWIKDVEGMARHDNISLMAKWLKSVNTSSAESRLLGKKTAEALGLTEAKYRKTLSKLRSHLKIVEKKMSNKDWNEINYENVPSYAMKNYRDAFMRHDEDGFSQYIDALKSGDAKINSGTLYPYDILESANLRGSFYWDNSGQFTINSDEILEAQWRALPNYVDGEHNILVMSDTSGSMQGRPMATSIGLAIYFAERNTGAYKDLFLTFSREPNFVNLRGNTLKEKVACVPSIVENTNLERAFDLILHTAIKNNVSQEEMPVSLIVISDMHFDGAQTGSRFDTFHDKMKQKFANAGYEMPTLIYWNVEQRSQIFHVDKDETNAILISGQSTSTFREVVNMVGKTPYEAMLDVLNNEMYDCVTL